MSIPLATTIDEARQQLQQLADENVKLLDDINRLNATAQAVLAELASGKSLTLAQYTMISERVKQECEARKKQSRQ